MGSRFCAHRAERRRGQFQVPRPAEAGQGGETGRTCEYTTANRSPASSHGSARRDRQASAAAGRAQATTAGRIGSASG